METNEKTIYLVNRLINTISSVNKTGNLYMAGYVDGLAKALEIIRDCDNEALEAMAKYYNEKQDNKGLVTTASPLL